MLDEIISRITSYLKHIEIESVDIADYRESKGVAKPILALRVVSKSFESIRSSTRKKIVRDIIFSREAELKNDYEFVYECFTPFEFKLSRMQINRLH